MENGRDGNLRGMTGQARNEERGRVVRLLIPLFLISGATSLIFETLWARYLGLVFGTSQLAICTVLTSFMGGLALGAFAAARWAALTSKPLRTYAILEMFIGCYALAFPFLLHLVTPLQIAFWHTFAPGPVVFGAFRFLLLGSLLLPPTLCMGATLPLLARYVTGGTDESGFQVGRLYGANTLGAVLGAALAGFLLLPALGLAATGWCTAAANGVLAITALQLSRRSAAVAPSPPSHAKQATALVGPAWRALLFVACLAGFSSLLCELAWFRLMTLMLGGSAYAFSAMLLAFLFGIGLGGWLAGGPADRSARRAGPRRVLTQLAWIQVGVAMLTWAGMYFYGQLPFVFVRLFALTEKAPGWFWPAQVLLATGVMFPPALLMGATFPFLVRAAAGPADVLNQPVGRLYGMNTLGAVVGAAAGGLLLLPGLHVHGTVLMAAAMNLVAAFVAGGLAVSAQTAVRPRRLTLWGLATAALVILGLWQRPPWDPILMTSGMYKYVSNLETRNRDGVLNFAVRPFDLVFYDEGLSAVISVTRKREGGNLALATNGKVDASSHADRETQTLVAHLPLAFRPQSSHVMVIGLASGMTLGSVTLYPGPARIDVVEIEPAVVEASHAFDEYNHHPLDDPRVHLHLNDARNHLLLTDDETYDLVIAEPSNAWLSGVANLFTAEFFALGKRKMKRGGLWTQWIQTYGMAPDDLRCLLGTFADAYLHVRLFRVDASDLILLGSDEPLPLDEGAMEYVFGAGGDAAEDLYRIGCRKPEHLLSLYQFDRDTIWGLARNAVRNTDDNMHIEYSAPRHLHEQTSVENSRLIQGLAEIPVDVVEGRYRYVELAKAYASRDWNWRRAFQALDDAEAEHPGDPEITSLRRAFREKAEGK